MGVFKVWVPSREHMSVQALYDAANVLYWKISERQNSTHLAFLKHQNTKTSLYELSKNHWVITLLGIFGSDRKNLQFTVPLDHPVPSWHLIVIPHLIRQGTHLALYQLDNPERADLEHRVGVVPARFYLGTNKQKTFCEQLINMIY